VRSELSGWRTWVAGMAGFLVGCSSGAPLPGAAPSRQNATRYNMARVYLEQGKVQESIRALEGLLKDDPKNADAHNLLGVVYWSISRREEARSEFEKALDLDEYMSDARVNLGVILSEEGEYSKAEAEFRRALDDRTYATPEKPLVNLAVNHLKLGRAGEAMTDAQEAIRRNPRYARAYEIYVEALQKADPGATGTEYRTLLRDMDRSQDFHLNLAEAFLKENDSRHARAHFRRVVALDPASEQAGKARQALEKLP